MILRQHYSILEQPQHTDAAAAAAVAAYHSAAVLGRSSNKLTAVACGNFLLSPDSVRFGYTLCVLICWLIVNKAPLHLPLQVCKQVTFVGVKEVRMCTKFYH